MIAALTIGVLLQAAPFAPMGYPGADPGLPERIHALCPVPTTTDRVALVANEERLANRVRDARGKVTAAQWRALACGRARLQSIGALSSRASHLMNEGTPWGTGAIDAALHALELEPTEATALPLLALLSMADAEPDQLPALAKLMRAAVDAGSRVPAVLRACSDFALRNSDSTGIRACAAAGLAAGSDSTWHLLRLTRQAFRDADTLGGMRFFVDAAGAAHDSLARRDLEWQLQWFVTPAELAAWRVSPDSSHAGWVRDRLLARDVHDGHPPGSRLAEHYARLEFVEKSYRMALPAQLRRAALGGTSVFLGVDGSGNSTSATGWAEYRRWQVDFDDRGVVWMRFGRPDKVAQNVAGKGAAALETWRYDLDGTPMLVHFTEADFDGSSGTTTMVVGVVGEWQCGIDSWRCLLAQMGGVSPEQIQRLREVDREYLAIATTKDDNSPRGQQPIHAVAQLFQLWDALSEEPLAVIAYGMRLEDLKVTRDSSRRESARVELALARWQPATAEWQEDSLPGDFVVPARKEDRTHLTGFTTLPGVGGVASGSHGLPARSPLGACLRQRGPHQHCLRGALGPDHRPRIPRPLLGAPRRADLPLARGDAQARGATASLLPGQERWCNRRDGYHHRGAQHHRGAERQRRSDPGDLRRLAAGWHHRHQSPA